MKESEVPQDSGAVYEGKIRRLTWAVGEDGRYRGVQSQGWEAEIDATAHCTARNNERIQVAHASVLAGTQSPLAYHMVANLLDESGLAMEVGTWTWRVRRHLKPTVFGRLSQTWLKTYAEVLGLSIEELQALPSTPEQLSSGPPR